MRAGTMKGAAWLVFAAALLAPAARAQGPSFIARADRGRAAVGEALVFEVTLSLQQEARVDGYHAPDFKGFRVLGEQPSQSTQIQMTGTTSFVQTVYSWRYELEPTDKGAVNIGAARVRVGGRELRTSPVTLMVGDAVPGAAPRPHRGGVSPLNVFPSLPPAAPPQPASGAPGKNFLRVVPSKTKAYVGEQVTVEWFLYLTERQDRYLTVVEPHADGFWSEDLPVPSAQGRLALQQGTYDGQTYLVAPLLRRALFALQPGRLTITPMESEISQVDFFGSTLRTDRLKAEPLSIDIMPLPTAGQPRGFDPAAVGQFTIAARVDHERAPVGEPVTLTLTITGQGNLRKLPAPPLEPLAGWKAYDPKVSVNIQPGDVVSGVKTVEYLLLPERPGTTMIPAFVLPYFDPAAGTYTTQKTAPLRIEVVGEAAAGAGKAAPLVPAGGGAENLLGIDIRPLRARATLHRDLGTTLYRSRLFLAVLGGPPLAFGLTVMIGRIRDRLSQDTERARRRKLRRLVRRRLGAAEDHMESGRASPFYVEIDRVLRELLSGKLARPVTGLAREELRALMVAAGAPADLAERAIAELEACDRARFAPGGVDQTEMRAALDRAGELIMQIDRTPLRGEAAA
jgi:hypothetical protein